MKAISFGTTVSSDGADASRCTAAMLRRSLRAASKRILATLELWRRRSRERQQLARLDDRMLRDIGINRVDVWAEINKPFWRK